MIRVNLVIIGFPELALRTADRLNSMQEREDREKVEQRQRRRMQQV